MLKHYVDTKREHSEYLLLYRVGDFFEAFFQDAEILADKLELTLTKKDGGKDLGYKVPMSGVPQHALDKYLTLLLKKNTKVAVCDQMELSSMVETGSLIKRQVTRLLTPGTLTEDSMLDSKNSNYLAAVSIPQLVDSRRKQTRLEWAIAFVDISTGEFGGMEGTGFYDFVRELVRLNPAEVLVQDAMMKTDLPLQEQYSQWHAEEYECSLPLLCYTVRSCTDFDKEWGKQELLRRFHCLSIEVFGLKESSLLFSVCGALFHYMQETVERTAPIDLKFFQVYRPSEFVFLDENTLKNLEILQTLREGNKKGSLFWAIDRTMTCMGARLLRRWLVHPLTNPQILLSRYDLVELLMENHRMLPILEQALRGVNDLERLACRVGSLRANEKDFYYLGESLKKIPQLLHILQQLESTEYKRRVSGHNNLLQDMFDALSEPSISTVVEEIDRHISSDVFAGNNYRSGTLSMSSSQSSFSIFRPGMNETLDQLQREYKQHMQWILEYEKKEQARLGVNSLKIGYHKTLGYYIAVPKRACAKIPSDYMRKQTLVGEERYTTAALMERERNIVYIKECLANKERELFEAFRLHQKQYAPTWRRIAEAIASIDVFHSFAKIAIEREYCRPQLSSSTDTEENKRGISLKISEGRHPVVEQMIPEGRFVANSISLSHQDCRLIVLTGPNSSGKSCYLRQIGTIQLLAQIGSFVPAKSAELTVVDSIFTRVGAVDDIGSGQSTFMVEMTETAKILRHATSHSLVLLDEIGRGTTTLDGLSIAWSVAEYLTMNIQCLTIFATHYHEMNELAVLLPWVSNFQVKVTENGEEVVFLHQVVPGGANKSYGIQVSRLAGLPPPVVERAQFLFKTLEHVGKQLNLVLRNQLNTGVAVQEFSNEKENHVSHAAGSLSVSSNDDIQAIQQQLESMKHQLVALDECFRQIIQNK
eukprot:jgi/Galph1/5458/GphlegSOOS_G4007.1